MIITMGAMGDNVLSLLSADIQKFCSVVQKRLLDEIVDRDVEKGKE